MPRSRKRWSISWLISVWTCRRLVEIGNPDPQLEIQGTVPEAKEDHGGLGVAQNHDMVFGTFHQGLHHQGHVRPVGHAHRKFQAPAALGQGPVGYLAGNQIGIGDHDLGIVIGLHHRGPQADLLDPPLLGAELHRVAHLDGAFEKHDETAHEIVHDGLHAETDADT
jgi:hypothetical protein